VAKALRRWPWCSWTGWKADGRSGGRLNAVLEWLAGLPPALTYLIIGVGAAVENVVPPVPADTFVLLGAFLAESGRASPWLVFVVTWVANVASAVGVYLLAYRYGNTFFATTVGRFLLQPRQLQQVGHFYARWGTPAIFVSRFLPAFRALVPVFAGVTRVPLRVVLVPLAAASALWYGALVYLGAMAGRNWDAIMWFFGRASSVLLLLAALLLGGVAWWWWRTRHREGG
jgi:membrane protein DedA with SNARE-associated domain